MGSLSQLSAHCWVATSSFCAMNTVVVCAGPAAAVIDPGVTGPELDELVFRLVRLGVKGAFGLSTHPHWDHLLWHPGLGDVPRFASPQAVDWLDADRLAAARAEAGDAAAGHLELLGLVEPLGPGPLEWGGPELEFVGHNGHAPGHLGIVVPDDGLLIAGDMCSDIEVPLLDLAAASGDPLGDYRAGLNKLARVAARCQTLVPGHGGVARGAAVGQRFERDQAYLDALNGPALVADERLDAALARGAGWLLDEHARQQTWLGAHHATDRLPRGSQTSGVFASQRTFARPLPTCETPLGEVRSGR